MTYKIVLTPEIAALAKELGASTWAILKWRQRGIPARWQLRLLEALDSRKAANGEAAE
jgi:hypothetical protein